MKISDDIPNTSIYKGFSLPEGFTWDGTKENGSIKSVTILDKNNNLYAKLKYHNGKLQGVSEFYDSGVLVEKRTYNNDIADGWGCRYENGHELIWYHYKDGKRVSEIGKPDDNGYRTEISLETHEILSVCKYGSDHYCVGCGYLYEENKLKKEVEYDSHSKRVIRTVREFSSNLMKEYDVDKHVIYEGGYLVDLKEGFPRNGRGKSFHGGKLLFDGIWNNGKPNGAGKVYDSEGNVIHEGVWKDGILIDKENRIEYCDNGIRKEVIMNDKKKVALSTKKNKKKRILIICLIVFLLICLGVVGFIVYWYQLTNGIHHISSKQDFEKANKKIRYLHFTSDCCNEIDFIELNLTSFSNLRSVEFGDGCLQNVQNMYLNDLNE